MTIQTIHELANPWDCEVRGLGYGLVKMMISGSVDSNPQFLVRLYDTGDIRTVDQNDIRLYGNPSAGESLKPKPW